MYKTAKIFFLIFFLSAVKTFSQISCTPTAGCAPLVGVNFTGAGGASGILWSFGDATYSNINNPTHTFSAPGTYTVQYTATVGGSTVSYSVIVKAYGKPSANFSYTLPASHCAPMTVPFTDMSTSSGTTIVSWSWSFGDGGLSNVKNPTYVYTIPGIFNVTLIAKDGNGCDSAMTKSAIIKVSAQPTVNITSNPTSLSSCTVPFTAAFSGTGSVSGSPSGGGLTYNWGFGNGQTSTSVTPNPITYTANGAYNVTLTCTDNNSCSKSVVVPVTLVQPVVKVKVPDTVCYGVNMSILDSSAAANTTWTWGDGSPNTNNTPTASVVHQYTVSGNKTITVVATIGSCTQTKTFSIYVQKVVAAFSGIPPSFACNSSMLINFNNTSTGASTYKWTFPNNFTTSVSSPTYNLTHPGSLNPYTILQMYKPPIKLVAISYFGCKDSITHIFDSLRPITSFFVADKLEGCVPLTVKFRDSSFSISPINYYEWVFGDGSANVSGPTSTLVVHTFTAPGTYSVTHIIKNVPGCKDTSFQLPIRVMNPPSPSFSFAPAIVCPNQPVTIINTTNPADSVNHWHVTSDNSSFSGCITNPNPSWSYNHTGVFGFTLSAYAHGCLTETTSTSSVTVKGPIVRGRFYTRCDSSFKVTFKANLQDALSAVWNFGDGLTNTVVASGTTVHTYTATGDYTVVLTGFNGTTGCPPFRDTLVVKVRDLKAGILSSSLICSGSNTSYSATTSQDVMAGCGMGYTWFFGPYPPVVTSSPITSYTLPTGTYTVKLVVKDVNDCWDTTKKVVKVSGITANASLSSTVGCLPSFSLQATNSSTSDTTITYSWNWGDGSAVSTATNPTHSYTAANSPSQTFIITLTATNANGCVSTFTTTVLVNAPLPVVTSAPTPSICAGTPITLFGSGVANVTNYVWNFADGSGVTTTTVNNISHTYTLGGTYSASLAIVDNMGCPGKTTYSVYVQDYPKAGFKFVNQCNPTTSVACSGCPVLFIDTTYNPFPGPRGWNLSNGSPVIGTPTVGTTYTASGSYVITLTVTSSFGCKSVTNHTLNVYGAKADFFTDKNIICKYEAIKFTIKDTNNIYTWHWDFGDGYDAGNASPISHNYNFHPPGGTTNASLIYWTADSACKYSVTKQVTIRDIIANFKRNNELLKIDTVHCLGVNDVFTNISLNATSWQWKFGDGSSSALYSPNHTYASAGIYSVSLYISDSQYGCKDTIRKTIQIITPPQATLSMQDTCAGRPAQIKASGPGTNTYIWHPGINLNDSTISNPIALLNTSTIFTLVITDPDGCINKITKKIFIQPPPVPINWDTTVVIGQHVTLPGWAGAGYSYTWNPMTNLSCDNCPYPISTSTVDIVYKAIVVDSMQCFTATNSFSIHIEPLSSVDVPTAFTPNGDGVNDVIYVDGWGIKKLNYFKIFNRWGQLLFESNDITVGWNGYYNGVLQNMETYVYQVSVETYIDAQPLLKTGSFKLIR